MTRTLSDVLKKSRSQTLLEGHESVLSLTKLFVEKRLDAVCIGENGKVSGVVSVRDVVKVISRRESLESTTVGQIMTKDPVVLPGDASTIDAVAAMKAGGFRHVPVVDKSGQYLGVVDALELVYDAIISLQTQFIPTRRAFSFFRSTTDMSNLPTIQGIASGGDEAAILTTDDDLLKACDTMTSARKTAIAVTDFGGFLVGIVTSRDILKFILKSKDALNDVALSQVMSRDPDSAVMEDTLLLALQKMQARGFRHLPVVDPNNRVMSMVSVLQVASDTLLHPDVKHETTTSSATSSEPSTTGGFWGYFFSSNTKQLEEPKPAEYTRSKPVPPSAADNLVFKFMDASGDYRRVMVPKAAEPGSFDKFLGDVRRRYGGSALAALKIKYFDEEGDEVRISSDEDFRECISAALDNEWKTIRAAVSEHVTSSTQDNTSKASLAGSVSYSSFAESESKEDRSSQAQSETAAMEKINEATILMQSGSVERAISAYDEAIMLDSTSARAHCGRAAARLIMHDAGEACKDYEKAIELVEKKKGSVSDDEIRSFIDMCQSGMAESLIELRRYEEAGALLSKIDNTECRADTVAAFKDELAASLGSAKKAGESNTWMEAVDLYTGAVRIDTVMNKEIGHPRDPKILSGRAKYYLNVDDVQMALVDYDLAIQVDPENKEALLGRAKCLEKLDKVKEAKEAYEHFLKIYSGDKSAEASLEALKTKLLEENTKKIGNLSSALKQLNLPK